MVMFDRNLYSSDGDGNYAVWLWQACPPLPFTNLYCTSGRPHGDQWTASGVDASYLDSNGLPGCWPTWYATSQAAPWIGQNGEVHNDGHFGVPAPYEALRYNEVVIAGSPGNVQAIPHMLKLIFPKTITTNTHYFPSTGHDGTANDLPAGVVMRIDPNITLTLQMFQGNTYKLAIARTLQKYGAIVADTDGFVATLGLENLAAEGSAHHWADLGISNSSALNTVPLDDYQFLYRGYGGPSPTEWDNIQQCEDRPIR